MIIRITLKLERRINDERSALYAKNPFSFYSPKISFLAIFHFARVSKTIVPLNFANFPASDKIHYINFLNPKFFVGLGS